MRNPLPAVKAFSSLAHFARDFRFYFSSDSANLPQFSSKGIFLRLWRGCKRSQTQESEEKDSSPQQEKDSFRPHSVHEYKQGHLNKTSSRYEARKSDQASGYFCTR